MIDVAARGHAADLRTPGHARADAGLALGGVGSQLIQPDVLARGVGQRFPRQVASEVSAIGGDLVGVSHFEAERPAVEVPVEELV